ncbi:unnamed protein product [marine sediment metagenome]|uniref:Uncharacterized protein n=1 Tax=marine sediment metagenome TaxID=412755 RepID=X1SQ81_9ZZZZ
MPLLIYPDELAGVMRSGLNRITSQAKAMAEAEPVPTKADFNTGLGKLDAETKRLQAFLTGIDVQVEKTAE